MQTCMCQSASVEAKNNSCELVLPFRLNKAGSLGFTRLHAPSWLRSIHQILVFTSYYRNAGIADTYHHLIQVFNVGFEDQTWVTGLA